MNDAFPRPWKQAGHFILDAKGGVVCDLSPSGPDGTERQRGNLITMTVNALDGPSAEQRDSLAESLRDLAQDVVREMTRFHEIFGVSESEDSTTIKLKRKAEAALEMVKP